MVYNIIRTQNKTAAGISSTSIGYLNPVWYTFNVYTAQFIGGSTSGVTVSLTTGSPPPVTVGDRLRVVSDDGKMDGVLIGVVASFTTSSITLTYPADSPLPATFGGGRYLNTTSERNANIQTRLVSWDGTVVLSKAASTWFANSNLTGIIDLQSELLSLAYQREQVPYSGQVYVGLSTLRYKIQAQSIYWNTAGTKISSGWSSIVENVLALPARKQIKEAYGNNLLDFTMKTTKGKFLTRFNSPPLWKQEGSFNLPRPLSFVIDPSSTLTSVIIVKSYWDHNRVLIAEYYDMVTLTGANLYTYFLKNVPSGTKFIKVAVSMGEAPFSILSPNIELEVKTFCKPKVILEWENSLGGLEQWVFDGKYLPTNYTMEERRSYELYDPDIENSSGAIGRSRADSFVEMELTDEFVKTVDIPWLHELKTSGQVRCIFPNGSAVFCVISGLQTPSLNGSVYATFKATVKFSRNFIPAAVDEFTTEYRDILNYAISQGFKLPSIGVQQDQNTLIANMKADGTWYELDLFYNFITDGSEGFSFINWKSPGTYQIQKATSTGVLTSLVGFRLSGVGHLNTGWKPGVNGVKYTLLTGSFGIYLSGGADVAAYDMGCSNNVDAISNALVLNAKGSGNLSAARFNDSTSLNGTGIINMVGLTAVNRSSVPIAVYIVKTSPNGSIGLKGNNSSVAVAMPTTDLWLGASNGNGTEVSPSARTMGMVFAGSGSNGMGTVGGINTHWHTYNRRYQHIQAYNDVLRRGAQIGQPLPSTHVQNKGQQFIRDLMDAGIWESLDVLYNFMTDSTLTFAMLNWRNPFAYQGSAQGTLTLLPKDGIQFTGGYINTGFIPNTPGHSYTQNEAGFGYQILNNIAEPSYDIGCTINGVDGIMCGSRAASNQMTVRVNSNTAHLPTNDSSTGFYHNTRVNATEFKTNKNAIYFGTQAAASTAVPSVALFLGSLNNNGVPISGTTRKMGMAWAGSSQAGKEFVFYAAWNNYRIGL